MTKNVRSHDDPNKLICSWSLKDNKVVCRPRDGGRASSPIMTRSLRQVPKELVSALRKSENKPTQANQVGNNPTQADKIDPEGKKRLFALRYESLGSSNHHAGSKAVPEPNIDSLSYLYDESEVFRAHNQMEHHLYRGRFWNIGKKATYERYTLLAIIGILQAGVAYFVNISCGSLIDFKFEAASSIMDADDVWSVKKYFKAFLSFYTFQLTCALISSIFVWIEPISAGSGIPEIKCYLNGIDLPNVTSLKAGLCKIIGVVFSVSAGLPIGKEGPMVHSGGVVATVVSQRNVRNDKSKRDYVAVGAGAGVCTAFSSPIGGMLFAFEEGASYWSPSLTWRSFFCNMFAIGTLYSLNNIGTEFGHVGFNKLFSFGNFADIGSASSYALYELLLFALLGVIGGFIGACFNGANERLTKWRMKHVNTSKLKRLLEVLVISSLVSVVSFAMPLCWGYCTDLPDKNILTPPEIVLVDKLVPFGCPAGQYNEVASLYFTEPANAIRLLFHMRVHSFNPGALLIFFIPYISLATIVYGIAIPSGLFVPSLLSGAAFGRLFGNLVYKISPTGQFAFSNTYSLIGAASVLGGMARMTISLTVILLECTGNEEYVLPLMISLMIARVVGGLFNEDLYHIHIHMKKGVHFLENELRSITRHHSLVAGEVMGKSVVFVNPVEKVNVIYELLSRYSHSNFPVVDTKDGDVLYGTINRNALCTLLQKRSFGHAVPDDIDMKSFFPQISNHMEAMEDQERYIPLVQWDVVERAYPKYPDVHDIRLSSSDKNCVMDLRPYANISPYTVQETTSVDRVYKLFRSLGLRFLPVVNKYNQCVGTITRDDLTADALAANMLTKGKHA